MKRIGALLALAGFVLAAVLFARAGLPAIVELLVVAGPGLVFASVVHILPLTLNAMAWQRLLPPGHRATLRCLTWATWARESVNALLPVARIGGEIVAYRIVRAAGVPNIDAVSTLIADMAISVLTQAAFTIVGVALLVLVGASTDIAIQAASASAVLLVLGVAFAYALRAGVVGTLMRTASRVLAGSLAGAVAGSVRIDTALRELYERRRDIAACAVWQGAGWIVGSLEIWLALRFLGHERGLLDAIAIDALIQAISSVAFVVPGALGVQEGGFLLVGAAFGLDATSALALAAARRLRDAIVFFPGLVAWYRAETRLRDPQAQRTQDAR
jgi:putative membrane protein